LITFCSATADYFQFSVYVLIIFLINHIIYKMLFNSEKLLFYFPRAEGDIYNLLVLSKESKTRFTIIYDKGLEMFVIFA